MRKTCRKSFIKNVSALEKIQKIWLLNTAEKIYKVKR